MKKALVTGITGQDGAYLAELLLQKGYEVHGIKRRTSLINTQRINHLYQDPHEVNRQFILHYGDLTDTAGTIRLIQQVQPDEIYNLGAMSHVGVSFEIPEYVADADGMGILRILEAVRIAGLEQKTKIYQASTSELFGQVQAIPQNEKTPFYPKSPYAIAKLSAYWLVVNYREAYGMFACNGILFNHESPLRGETFVTRKITRGVAELVCGLQKTIYLGNLSAKRDWGHARDYTEAMWLMLQQQEPEDFVIATGVTTSVRDFVTMAFEQAGISIGFEGTGLDEKAVVTEVNDPDIPLKKDDVVIRVDKRYFRPTEVDILQGDAMKAWEKLGWRPRHSLRELISEMVQADMQLMRQKMVMQQSGYEIASEFE